MQAIDVKSSACFAFCIFRFSFFILAFSALTTAVFLAFAGRSLGFYFSGFFLIAMLLPPLATILDSRRGAMLVSAIVVDGIAIVWLIAIFGSPVSLLDWLMCYAVLVAFAAAVLGVTRLLTWATREKTLAAAIATTLSLAWLIWPVWLPTPQASVVAGLVKYHPLFAVNGVLKPLGFWHEQRFMYHLTALGQDVSFTLPTIWPCVVAHAIVAAVFIAIVKFRIEKRQE